MLNISLKWADEDSGCNTGILKWIDGRYSEDVPENQSAEAWEIYFELHPKDKERFEFVDGQYQYINDF